MNNGWVKIHRQIRDNAFCSGNSERLGFWVQILLMANHETNEFYIGGQKVVCNPGEFATGREKLSEAAGLHTSKIERHLEILEKEGMIEQQTNSKFRIIKVRKWEEYQVSEQQMNNKRTTDEQQMNTNKNDKNDKNEKNTSMGEPISPTPNQIAKEFFDSGEVRNQYIAELSGQADERWLRSEFQRFVDYWTEPTKNGKSVRWETEKCFDVKRRIQTWLSRSLSPSRK